MGLGDELQRQLDSRDRAVEREKAEQLELQAKLRAISGGYAAKVSCGASTTDRKAVNIQVRDQLSDLEARRAVLEAMRSDHAQLALRSCVLMAPWEDLTCRVGNARVSSSCKPPRACNTC